MKLTNIHPWTLSPTEAIKIQSELSSQVIEKPPEGFAPKLVAGADVSFNRFSNTIFAAAVVVSLPDLKIVETRVSRTEIKFPYVPGLLSFRELPALEAVFQAIESNPDAVIMDGQGKAHPRRFGLACHAGLLLQIPTIGCAKSILIGNCELPAPERGARTNIIHNNETIGAALRTKSNIKPVYVSTGHLIDLNTACELILNCTASHRLPEPIRAAHDAANQARREFYG